MALLTPENLSKRRRDCGLSQKELAARANIDVNIVARLETSRRKMINARDARTEPLHDWHPAWPLWQEPGDDGTLRAPLDCRASARRGSHRVD